MNCNCCNCSKGNSCGDNSEIKIYGTLVNVTIDDKLKDARDEQHDPCKAKNWPSNVTEEGHNGALAYAYQLHDGRFRQDDPKMAEWERFLDEINKRVTDIVYDETGGGVEDKPITIIENPYTHDDNDNLVPIGGEPYDDKWLKGEDADGKDGIIGANPDNYDDRKDELKAVPLYPNGGNTPVFKDNIIDFILNLAAEVNDLRNRIIALEDGGTDTCLWTTSGDGICPKNSNAKVYSDQGFFDRSVNNPQS